MKSLLACLLLLTAAHVDAADPITLQDTSCPNGVCLLPAPTVDYLALSDTYGRVTISINGEIYDSGMYAVASPQEGVVNALLYAADGSSVTVSAITSIYYTRTASGRVPGMRIKHVELTGGSVQ